MLKEDHHLAKELILEIMKDNSDKVVISVSESDYCVSYSANVVIKKNNPEVSVNQK